MNECAKNALTIQINKKYCELNIEDITFNSHKKNQEILTQVVA